LRISISKPLASLSKENNERYFSYRYSISTPNLPAIKFDLHERDKDRLATNHHIENELKRIRAHVVEEIKLENRKARELVKTPTKPSEQTKQL